MVNKLYFGDMHVVENMPFTLCGLVGNFGVGEVTIFREVCIMPYQTPYPIDTVEQSIQKLSTDLSTGYPQADKTQLVRIS